MGKIIQDGRTFLRYANSHLIRKIDDIPALRDTLIALGEEKTHVEMSRYAVALAEHLLEMTGTARTPVMDACISINQKWQDKEVRFQDALEIAGQLNRLARGEKDPVRAKVLRALGQVAATPHVRWHALVASEYAVVVVNLLYPGDMERVRMEREWQIGRMESLCADKEDTEND